MKRSWKLALALLITLVALWLSFRKIDWEALGGSFSRANYLWVVLAAASSIFTVFALGWRWRILLNPKDRIGLGKLFRLNIICQYANILMPARMGELVRAYLTSLESRASAAFVLGTIAIERVFDVIVFGLLWVLVPVAFVFRNRAGGFPLVFFFASWPAG
jgi:uncharacterized protein (TIRG00374 family)